MSKRLTKADIEEISGIFNPVDHVVLGLDDDELALAVAKALRGAGFADEDVLVYSGAEFSERLHAMVDTASEGAGFGYEITLMRRYLKLAAEGCGWVVVYAPDSDAAQRVIDVATRYKALCATRYRAMVSEDLV